MQSVITRRSRTIHLNNGKRVQLRETNEQTSKQCINLTAQTISLSIDANYILYCAHVQFT